jgi:GH25 family lysozyme M1 (1,4-beta-N-acetylmuramidase)
LFSFFLYFYSVPETPRNLALFLDSKLIFYLKEMIKMVLKIVDVSSYQGNYALGSHGEDGVIIKATEGTGYVNPYCDYVAQQAISQNKPWGLYHYASGGNPISEAQYFIDNIKGYLSQPNCPILWLDWEGGGNAAWGNGHWAATFIAAVKNICGKQAGIYTGQDGVNQTSGYLSSSAALWMAAYPVMYDVGWNPPDFIGSTGNWDSMTGWQFTSASGLDRSFFYVDRDGWNRIAGATGGNTSSPAPAPAPQAAPITKVHVYYRMHIQNGSWLDEVTDFGSGDNGFSGYPCHSHDLLSIRVSSGSLQYRVHAIGIGWMDWVYQGNINDTVNGCAGELGATIDAVQMIYITPSGQPYQQAWYRSQTTQRSYWLDTVCDDGTSINGYSDTYAGVFGEPMDRLQISIGIAAPF